MKVFKYDEFDNIEYRKGSIEFGGILLKLMEFLRLYKTDDILSFNFKEFTEKSNITIDDIKKIMLSKEKTPNLYDFVISLNDNEITFKELNKRGKTRPFESNNF